MKDEALSPAVSLSKQGFTRLSEGSLDLKRSSGRHGLTHASAEKAGGGGLDRTSSQVSTSSIESSLSVKSNASAAGNWSPRTVNVVKKQGKLSRSRARTAINSASPLSPEGSSASLDLLPNSPGRSNAREFIAASRPQVAERNADLMSEHSVSSIRSETSSSSPPQRTASALAAQHSILDPLPEQPTDIVRQRKVFGSTFSVGKLGGELPYTPLPRARGSLTQPPWVAAAARQATFDAQHQHAACLASQSSLSKHSVPAEDQPIDRDMIAHQRGSAPEDTAAALLLSVRTSTGKPLCHSGC